MRARGLKQLVRVSQSFAADVAPHAGAWIETQLQAKKSNLKLVAPHAGAWIETAMRLVYYTSYQSRAPCGRVD